MVNPYEAGASRRYAQMRRFDEERRRYVAGVIQQMNFEYGQDSVNCYDLRQVNRIRQSFQRVYPHPIYRR